jgi:hypothetical protein
VTRLRLLPLVLACALALPAAAQLKKSPSPKGAWQFTTNDFRGGCRLAGDITLTETKTNTFSCSFEANWTCDTGPLRSVRTQQSCSATQAGAKILVTAKLDKIVSADPPDSMSWLKSAYAPDNFDVTINSRGDEMNGLFKSYDIAPVKFRRKNELIS